MRATFRAVRALRSVAFAERAVLQGELAAIHAVLSVVAAAVRAKRGAILTLCAAGSVRAASMVVPLASRGERRTARG